MLKKFHRLSVIAFLGLILSLALYLPGHAYAQPCPPSCPPPGGPGTINNPALSPILQDLLKPTATGEINTGYWQLVLSSVITVILIAGSITFLFIILWAGVSWITAGSDKGAVEAAKQKLTNAVIGLLIMFAAFAISLFMEGIFKVNILTIDIAPLIIQ